MLRCQALFSLFLLHGSLLSLRLRSHQSKPAPDLMHVEGLFGIAHIIQRNRNGGVLTSADGGFSVPPRKIKQKINIASGRHRALGTQADLGHCHPETYFISAFLRQKV